MYCPSPVSSDEDIGKYYNGFCHSITQPLVYYTQIPQPLFGMQRNKDTNKTNPNCFVKAFRWYTQEHVAQPPEKALAPDVAGFAAWLDKKYDEYIRDNRLDQFLYDCRIGNCESIVREQSNKHNYFQASRKRRMKSPWKRWRKSTESTHRLGQKDSLEYILRPKNLAYSESERHLTSTPGCCRSNTTIISSEIQIKQITISKQGCDDCRGGNMVSPGDIFIEKDNQQYKKRERKNKIGDTFKKKIETEQKLPSKENTVKNIDTGVQYQNNDVARSSLPKQSLYVDNLQCNIDPVLDLPWINIDRNCLPNCECNHATRCPCQDVYCQYSRKSIPKIDGSSQYSDEITYPSMCPCLDNNSNDNKQGTEKSDSQSISWAPNIVDPIKTMDMCCLHNDNGTTSSIIHRPTRSYCAQTSDLEINVYDDFARRDYPLFMKIVCADKLDEEINMA